MSAETETPTEPEMLAIIRERDRALAAVGIAEPHAGPARLLHYLRPAPSGDGSQAAEVTVDEAGLVTITAELLALLLAELGFHLEAEDVLA